MTQDIDLRALVRVIAAAVAGGKDEAEDLLKWAYATEEEDKPIRVQPKKQEKAGYGTIVEEIVQAWNISMSGNIPKVRDISKGRSEKVRLRIVEMGGWEKAREILGACFEKISHSDFCNGKTGTWVATFDWFFSNDKNWRKVLEGNYDNRTQKTDYDKLQESIAKADAYYEQRARASVAGAGGNTAGGWRNGPDEQ